MTNQIKLFDLTIKSEFNQYRAIWLSGESRRPHDHPQYMLLMMPRDHKPMAMVYYENETPKIIYAFYLKELSDYAFFGSEAGSKKLMISAYGYGGPVRLMKDSADYADFEACLDSYIQENEIVSEFVREDLFSEFKVSRKFEGIKQQENVVVGLSKSPDVLWSSYKHSVRKNVNRAKSSNLNEVFDFKGEMLRDFVDVYHMTMNRTNAKQSFLIGINEFMEFNKYLIEDDLGFYIHIKLEDKVIATELVLKSPRHVYSFLGGSDMEYSNLRPSDYLKHMVNLWAIDNKIEGYVLGGGVRPYDGIYTFKLAFDLNGSVPFHIQKNVHNDSVYQSLISLRQKFERVQGLDWSPNPDFFPSFLS